MSKTNKTEAKVLEGEIIPPNQVALADPLAEFKTTSAKIRHFASVYKANGGTDLPYSFIVKELKKANVMTKEGNQISYQMVRNILLQPLTSK